MDGTAKWRGYRERERFSPMARCPGAPPRSGPWGKTLPATLPSDARKPHHSITLLSRTSSDVSPYSGGVGTPIIPSIR